MCPVVKPMNLSPASAFTAPSPSSSSSWRRHWTRKQKRRAPAVRSNHLSSFESSHFIVETTRFHRPDFVCCFSPFSHLVPSRSTPPHPLPPPPIRFLPFQLSGTCVILLEPIPWIPQLLLDENNPPEGGGGGGGFLFFLRLCRPFSCLACVPYHVSTLRNASKKKKEEGEGQEKRRRRRRRRWRTSPV